jgi:hypothetical protein
MSHFGTTAFDRVDQIPSTEIRRSASLWLAGETDLAFQWLDRAVEQQHPGLSWIKANFATFTNITNDPRYPQLLKKIGLPLS